MTIKTGASADRYFGSGKAIKAALKKYGRKNFAREILEYHETREDLIEAEIRLIEKYNAVVDPMYYNMSVGGEGFLSGEDNPMFGVKHTPEQKAARSKRNTGKGNPQYGITGPDATGSLEWTIVRNGVTEVFGCAADLMTHHKMSIGALYTIRNQCKETGMPYVTQRKKFTGLLITSAKKKDN